MLHLITWLGIYAFILVGIGRAVGKLSERQWFKIAFLPGTLLAVFVQAVASFLCVGRAMKCAIFEPDTRAFTIQRREVPMLAGVAFVLVTHALLYTIFVYALVLAESRLHVPVRMVHLPNLYPRRIMEGEVFISLGGYFKGLAELVRATRARPLFHLGILYVMLPAFASLRLRGRQFGWAALFLILLGATVVFLEWFGLGIEFMTRGWWASMFHFPAWWAIFSLYLTAALITLVVLGIPHAVRLVADTVREEGPKGGGSGGGKGGDPSKSRSGSRSRESIFA